MLLCAKGWCDMNEEKIPEAFSLFVPPAGCNDKKEVCSCLKGQVQCQEVKCEEVSCTLGQRLVQTDDSCSCPKCIPNLDMCYYEGRHLKVNILFSFIFYEDE